MMSVGGFMRSPKGLEAEAALAGGFGQRLDAAVVDVGAAVEDHFLDAGLDGALGDQLADGSSGCGVGAGLEPPLGRSSSVEAAASVWPLASSMICA